MNELQNYIKSVFIYIEIKIEGLRVQIYKFVRTNGYLT